MKAKDISFVAKQVRAFFGPGKVLEVGRSAGAVLRALRLFGFDGNAFAPKEEDEGSVRGALPVLPFGSSDFDTVVVTDCLEYLEPANLDPALKNLRRICRRNMLLRVPTLQDGEVSIPFRSVGNRAWWEAVCFAAGWRKHPCYYQAADYAALQHDGPWIVIPLEKLPETAWDLYPLDTLRDERDLHMDMLRESGSRSDAHVFRYQLAAQFVRPGDVVLDAACGLGYGSYLISTGTKASKVIGIDGSGYAAEYAARNFVSPEGMLEFREGFLPQCLSSVADNSVDLVISFETLEHVQDPEGLLAEFNRVLAPGGRFIGSVPNDWSDETGEDPNPFHLHVYTLDKFRRQLRAQFDIETIFSQTADRVKRLDAQCEWISRPRSITELPGVDVDPAEAEWWLCVAMKSPLVGTRVPYVERSFSVTERETAGNALAFGRDYENPWLVRSLVAKGLRTESSTLQVKWAQHVSETSTPGSADRGAALTILAYRLLDQQFEGNFEQISTQIEDYIATPPGNPNAHRWVISLRYVMALVYLDAGRRDDARAMLQSVLQADAAAYSITLLTKTVDAAWLLGSMFVADGEHETARTIWQTTAVSVMKRVGGHLSSIQADYDPPSFEPREVGFIADRISRLLACAKNVDLAKSRPSVYQAAVDFGGLAAEMSSDATARERERLEEDLKNLRTYLDALLEGKQWLEDNRTRTLAYVDELKAAIDEQEAKAAALRLENETLRSNAAQGE